MTIDRRDFLRGAAASAAAVALPLPAVAYFEPAGPIFEGAIGVYNGVVFREVFDLNASARQALRAWADRRDWGVVTSTPIDGVVVDGCS